MLDLTVLTEGGVSYTELREMSIPDLELLQSGGRRLAARIKRATK